MFVSSLGGEFAALQFQTRDVCEDYLELVWLMVSRAVACQPFDFRRAS